jgi:small basic protein
MIPQNITVTEWWFVALVAAAFAYLGARRGLTIELFMLVGVIVGVLLADRLADFMVPWINLSWQLTLAMVREHAMSPEAIVKVLFNQPKLITQDIHRLYLGSMVFVGLVALGYSIGRRRSAKAKPPRPTTRVLAAMVGAVNGYLIAFFLFPRHITSTTTVITMSSVNIRSFLQIRLGVPILIAVLVLITIGVLGAREGGKPKGK